MTRLAVGAIVFLLAASGLARAQMAIPAAAPPSGASLFRNQCATCHTLDPALPPRQGPTLAHVVGRHVGAAPGFHYSAGFAQADWSWDATRLDQWITNPQAMIPGAMMPYHQPNPAIRHLIVQYLQEQR